MAVIRKRVDDVLQAQGKEVAATRTVTVRVPGVANDTGKSVPVKVDVSEQGNKSLQKMIREAEAATKRAWAPILALKPGQAQGKDSKESPTGEDSQDDESAKVTYGVAFGTDSDKPEPAPGLPAAGNQ